MIPSKAFFRALASESCFLINLLLVRRLSSRLGQEDRRIGYLLSSHIEIW